MSITKSTNDRALDGASGRSMEIILASPEVRISQRRIITSSGEHILTLTMEF